MKKIFKTLLFIAAAALTFTSCEREELANTESDSAITLHITANTIDTKTVFGEKADGAYPVKWTANKQVAFSLNETTPLGVTPVVINEGAGASFDVTFTEGGATGTVYAFSPKGVYDNKNPENNQPGFTSLNTTYKDAYLNIPSIQTPLANSCDESAQALFASQEFNGADTDINMTFSHVVAYGKMAIKNFTGTIAKVDVVFPEPVCGTSCYYYYDGNDKGKIKNADVNKITLNSDNVVGNVFWFACAPTAGATGSMKVIVTDSDNKTYTKSIDLTEKALPFNQGKVSSFGVDMTGISEDETPDTPVYTLSFTKLTTGTNYNNPANVHTVDCNGIAWDVYGNQSAGNDIRVGGKTTTNTDRTLSSKNVMPAKISKVVIAHSGIANGKSSSITVNSVSLKVSSTSTFSTPLETVKIDNPSVTSGGVLEFAPSSGVWAAGFYYQVVVNYKISGTNNCYLVIDNVQFFGEQADVPDAILSSISVTGQTTEFALNDNFTFGGTVTAKYSDGTTSNVTNAATFSGYNMAVAGAQTVKVQYSEAGVTAETEYGINVTDPNQEYDITLSCGDNGTASFTVNGASATKAKAGQTIVVTATPATSYVVNSVKYNDTAVSIDDNGTYQFVMPQEDVTIVVSFKSESTPEYTLISNLSDIISGNYVITALNNGNYYSVPNTTISGQTFTCTQCSVENNVITTATDTGIFEFTAVDGVDNAFYIYNTNLNKYLVATGSKTFGYEEKDATNYGYWKFTTVSSGGFSGEFSVTHSSKTHYMRAYNNSVRCYDGPSNSGVYLFKASN